MNKCIRDIALLNYVNGIVSWKTLLQMKRIIVESVLVESNQLSLSYFKKHFKIDRFKFSLLLLHMYPGNVRILST